MRISWRWLMWLLVITFVMINVFFALRLDLSMDAAHYALYGKFLDWSYFDHPPLIGWLQAPLLLFGQQDYLMRVWPLLLSIATPLSLYYLAPKFFTNLPKYFAELCVVTYYTVIVLNLISLDPLPQKLLVFIGLWISYAALCVSQTPTWRNWLLLGLGVGLAALAEYTAVLLGIGLVIYLWLYQRQQLATLKPYAAVLVSLSCMLPILYWNWQHQWVSFEFQLHHGFGRPWSWKTFLDSLAAQIPSYGFVVFFFGLIGAWQALRHWQDTGSRVLVCLSLPILVTFFYSGGYRHILGWWPALGWVLLIPIAVRYAMQNWHCLWVKVLSVLTASCAVIGYTVLFSQIMWGWINIKKDDLVRDFYGWSQAAQHAKQLLTKFPTLQSESPRLFVNNFHLASRLAWYAKAPVQVADADTRQFNYWFGKPSIHSEGILVVWKGGQHPKAHSQANNEFASCENLGEMPVKINNQLVNTFYFYHCKHFNS